MLVQEYGYGHGHSMPAEWKDGLMARTLARLQDRQVRAAKPKGTNNKLMLCDGGLYLQVTLGHEDNIRRS